jgi:hypothetical protein
MRLELGTFPVTEVVFGPHTRYDRGRLEVDREAALAAVREDPRIVTAALEIARPGESVRIWPVRDVIEPRVKVERRPGPDAPPGGHGRRRGVERELARCRRGLRRDVPRHVRASR